MSSIIPDLFPPKEWRPFPKHANHCSQIGHPCAYKNYLARKRWKDAKPLSDGLLRIFGLGNRCQHTVMSAVHERGLDVIGYEQTVQWPEYQLTGRYDLLLQTAEGKVHLDIKSMSPNIYPRINTVDDLRNSEHVYHRMYVTQASLYASHPDVDAPLTGLLCYNKNTSETKAVVWKTDEAKYEIETALERCWQINTAIDGGATRGLATPGQYCMDCDYSHICEHFTAEDAGYEMAPEEVSAAVTELQALKALCKPDEERRRALANQLKAHWKTQEPGQHVCGQWIAKITEVPEKQMPAYSKAGYQVVTYKKIGGENE